MKNYRQRVNETIGNNMVNAVPAYLKKQSKNIHTAHSSYTPSIHSVILTKQQIIFHFLYFNAILYIFYCCLCNECASVLCVCGWISFLAQFFPLDFLLILLDVFFFSFLHFQIDYMSVLCDTKYTYIGVYTLHSVHIIIIDQLSKMKTTWKLFYTMKQLFLFSLLSK